jgi:hypothetical protein
MVNLIELTLDDDLSFRLVSVTGTSVHASICDLRILDDQFPLSSIFGDLDSLVSFELFAILMPHNFSSLVIQFTEKCQRVFFRQLLMFQHLGELVWVFCREK